MFYVNLPLRYIADGTPYLDRFLEYLRQQASGDLTGPELGPELGLELGMDAQAMEQLPLSWHQELAARLREQGVALALHLPFRDLAPGSVDHLIREATRQRLQAAFELARVYAPAHLVGHPIYNDDAWDQQPERWAACCAAVWSGLLDGWPGHPPLFLENIFEREPQPLALLMSELAGHDAGICFDVGHWYSFSRGKAKGNLEEWVTTLAPWIRHLHLHDNDGTGDEHKGLGQGEIDFAQLFALLKSHDTAPSATFEPHCEEAFAQSLAYVAAHPELFVHLS